MRTIRSLAMLGGVTTCPLRDHPGAGETAAGARLAGGAGAEYLLPLTVEGTVVAILAVGIPQDGGPLNSDDLQLLVSFCRHAAVAFAGARLYSALAEKVSEIEALKEFNESILESSRVGLLVTDPAGRVVGVNRAFEEIFGAARPALRGRPVEEIVPGELFRDARPQPANAAQVAEPGASGPGGADRRRAGRPDALAHARRPASPGQLTRSPLQGAEGEPLGTVITVDDVTEQVRREEDLQHREHLASIGLLASGVAHEVNTPLTGISSYTQMLLEKRPPHDPEYASCGKSSSRPRGHRGSRRACSTSPDRPTAITSRSTSPGWRPRRCSCSSRTSRAGESRWCGRSRRHCRVSWGTAGGSSRC